MPGIKRKLTDILIFSANMGREEGDSDETRLRKSVLSAGLVGCAILYLFTTGPFYIYFNEPAEGWNYIGWSIITLVGFTIVYLRKQGFYRLIDVLGFTTLASNLVSMIILGTFINAGAALLWGLIFPVVGNLLLHGFRRAGFWFALFICNLILYAILLPHLRTEINLPQSVAIAVFTFNLIVMSTMLMLPLSYFVTQRDLSLVLLKNEQDKSEHLLLNILPKEIAAILKDGDRMIADQFEGVSILFADVVNFTPMSAQLSPSELVGLLNDVFSYFDILVEKYDLEKIKTIGDCYMVASGVPRPRRDHALVLTQMALDMLDYVQTHTFNGKQLSFRIGINSGVVVAGVIGRKKFSYDLWGDAVNTASRMESHGVSNVIQITRATYEQIHQDYECVPKGTISVKGKGEMEIWHVQGKIESKVEKAPGIRESHPATGTPNPFAPLGEATASG